jgi:hypothetical protein
VDIQLRFTFQRLCSKRAIENFISWSSDFLSDFRFRSSHLPSKSLYSCLSGLTLAIFFLISSESCWSVDQRSVERSLCEMEVVSYTFWAYGETRKRAKGEKSSGEMGREGESEWRKATKLRMKS